MQLKWLRIRFRGGRGMHRVSAAPLSGESRDCPALLLGAGQQRSVPAQKVGREVSPHSCGARIAVPSGGPGATEESREFSRARHRPPLPGGGRAASVRLGPAVGTACSVRRRSARSDGGSATPCAEVVGARMAASDPS